MAKDPTTIDPYSSAQYKSPVWAPLQTRDIDQRRRNFIGPYLYDMLLPSSFEEDTLSLPDGVYELRSTGTGFFFIFDSKNQWTGYTVQYFVTDSDGEAVVVKKPIILTFLKGSGTAKIPKKQRGKYGDYMFTLIDNTYPKYGSPPRPSNITANATVVDSRTGEPIKGVKTD
jgi:hypothetical protein